MEDHNNEKTIEPAMSLDALEEKYACDNKSDISKCFARLHLELAEKTDRYERDILNINIRVLDLETHNDEIDKVISTVTENDIPAIEGRLENTDNALLKLDMWSRKWNIIIRNCWKRRV